MHSFPLVVECGLYTQESLEELSQGVDQVLVQKARCLWEEWLSAGHLIEADGYLMWNGEAQSISDLDLADEAKACSVTQPPGAKQ